MNKKLTVLASIGILATSLTLAIVFPLVLNSKKDNGNLVTNKTYTGEQIKADPADDGYDVIKNLSGVKPFADEDDEAKREEYFAAHYDAAHWVADVLFSIRTLLLEESNANTQVGDLEDIVVFNKVQSKGTSMSYDIHVSMFIENHEYDIDFKSEKSNDDSSIAYLPYTLRSNASAITSNWDLTSSGQGERAEGTVDGSSATGFYPYGNDGGYTFAGIVNSDLSFTVGNWKK